MGTTYDPTTPILGMEARRFRTLLNAWEKRRDLRALSRVSSLETSRLEIAAVVDEAEARGLLGFPPEGSFEKRFGFTDDGLALYNASNRKRIEASKAWAILEPVLTNAATVNSEGDMPFEVNSVWLYGSLAKGSETVDDIDIVVEWRHRRSMGPRESYKMAMRMCRDAGAGPAITRGGPSGEYQALQWVVDRSLYGSRRNPRLSVREDRNELIDMAVPCRLVFDRELGIDLNAPLLEHHPKSNGRQAHIGPPRVLPDLKVVPELAPPHCKAVVALVVAEIGMTPNNHYRIGVICQSEPWVPKHLKEFVARSEPLDGRSRAVVHFGDDRQGVLVESHLEDGVLRVDTGVRSEGEPADDEALDAYLRALMACASHRAEMRGERIEAGYIDGDEVDPVDGLARGGRSFGR